MKQVGTPVREPNSPGIAGYALGSLVSFGVVAVALLAGGVSDGGTPAAAILYLPIAYPMVAVVGAPVALAGCVLTQLICHQVRLQAVHVLVIAVAGAAVTYKYYGAFDLGSNGPSVLMVTIATGIGAGVGRIVVIPMVDSRRRLAAIGQLRGTARW